MKRTLILSLALAMGFSTFNANAHEDHQTVNTAPAKNNPGITFRAINSLFKWRNLYLFDFWLRQ
ncbi:hypothetical protein CS542_02720 [Pedobacter sp. IW39]|nr:hypothetical protein CS542_02720 [Pedobacter sp. IW39]